MPRIFTDENLQIGQTLVLSGGQARHVQVLRMQPGEEVTLFNGQGGEFRAGIERMGRSDVSVKLLGFVAREAEPPVAVHMLVGAPANERMDWLVEKAAELGVASIWPVLTERSVMRLSGERAGKKAAHWQSVAQSACEQCGRNRVPVIHPMQNLREVLSSVSTDADNAPVLRRVLSLRSRGNPWEAVNHAKPGTQIWVLNGPEGGLTEAEEALAVGQGFVPAGLGPRVLRAETAALVALTRCVQYES